MAIVRDLIGLTRLRGGALSPIRLYGDIVQQVETEDLKSFQCGFESHYPYHYGTIHIYFLSRQSGKTLDGENRLAQWVDGVWSLTWLQTKGSVGSIPAQPHFYIEG